MNKRCTFVSVWDGGIRIETPAMMDEATGIVSDIEIADLPGNVLNDMDVLDQEFILIGDREYDVESNDDGTYSVIRPYSVFFSRNGYAEVMAKSPDEARRIGDEELKYDDVSWDDDWNVTDIQLEE